MHLFYRIAHLIGFRPWERDQLQRAELISALFDREEKERTPPFGRALDLGCGTGRQSVALAARGWQVTGIDLVPKALQIARKRARNSGVEIQFISGDVTALRAAGVGDGFRFFLDFGCFHGLTDGQREAFGREVVATASVGATMIMFAFPPGKRGPLPRGASAVDIASALPGWEIIAQDEVPSPLPGPLQHGSPRLYRLRYGSPE